MEPSGSAVSQGMSLLNSEMAQRCAAGVPEVCEMPEQKVMTKTRFDAQAVLLLENP